ncbi:MAG: hypothetical protein C0436_04650 [Alphaproteobacteria bacterium]|nr:hypothetical protein [Alphaproteobacteria bacterium]
MSQTKIRGISEIFLREITEEALQKQLMDALRSEHHGATSLAKQVARTTGISAATVHHWMRHSYLPKTTDLLTLMAHYPGVLRIILLSIGLPELWDAADQENLTLRMRQRRQAHSTPQLPRGDIPVTPNVTPSIKDLAPNPAWNMRQEWFMQQVTLRHSCTSKDIEQHWSVNRRTAKRDIAGLVALGAIRFIRSGKSGYYMAEVQTR